MLYIYNNWIGFFCSPAGYISRIDSLCGSLTRCYLIQPHAFNTFVNVNNHDITRLYTSTSG